MKYILTIPQVKKMVSDGKVPEFFSAGPFSEGNIIYDDVSSEYVRKKLHTFTGGMKLPNKRRSHVIRAILYLAEMQQLVVKERMLSQLMFTSTEVLRECWGDIFGEELPAGLNWEDDEEEGGRQDA